MLGWSKNCDDKNSNIGNAFCSAEINVNPNTDTIIPLDSVKFDYGNFFLGDGKINISEDGIYLIAVTLTYAPTASGSLRLQVNSSKGGFVMAAVASPSQSQGTSITQTSMVSLHKGEVLELQGRHTAQNNVKTYIGSGVSIGKMRSL